MRCAACCGVRPSTGTEPTSAAVTRPSPETLPDAASSGRPSTVICTVSPAPMVKPGVAAGGGTRPTAVGLLPAGMDARFQAGLGWKSSDSAGPGCACSTWRGPAGGGSTAGDGVASGAK